MIRGEGGLVITQGCCWICYNQPSSQRSLDVVRCNEWFYPDAYSLSEGIPRFESGYFEIKREIDRGA